MLTKWITLHEIVLAWELKWLLIGGLTSLYNEDLCFNYSTYILLQTLHSVFKGY